jgi:ABC-type transport system substrate-binding protein
MIKLSTVSTIVLLMAILLSPFTLQSAIQNTSTVKKTALSSTKVEQPQPGGIYNVIVRGKSNLFGYPPRVSGSGRDYIPPFFDHLLSMGDDGKYKPELALSWDVSKDGKTITFKLRRGVTFHDGTPFNAQAVKANIDNLIRPEGPIISGITSVDVVDEYTVRLNLPAYNNLFLFHFATNPTTYMYSPDALKKNGSDWATTHPVGTGPFMLKGYEPDISLMAIKNPNYWQKGLPYLDGIKISIVPDPMTETLLFKSGQAHAIYDAQIVAAPLRDEGYPLQMVAGGYQGINFDTKNSEIFAKRQVREAIEYAIDKEAICKGPGLGLYTPLYQVVSSNSPDYNPACPPRKYNPVKAKRLLAEAGYPNGFSFKITILDSVWKDGWVAVQSYLDKVGIKMEINFINPAAFNLIRMEGKIEKGAAAYQTNPNSSNTLFTLDSFWRSNSPIYKYVDKPSGIDQLIDQAKLSKKPGTIKKINRQVIKLLYDDETIVPLWLNPRIAVVAKLVQDTGWFIDGDPDNNQFGTRTWLKK